MYDGFIRVASVTPQIMMADVDHNAAEITGMARQASKKGAKIIVFPELCLTGADCRDLFFQNSLLEAAESALFAIAKKTAELDAIIFLGMPIADQGSIYNVTAVLNHGDILGFVPKSRIGHDGHIEGRPFSAGSDHNQGIVLFDGTVVSFGTKQIFSCDSMPELMIGVEIGEDYLLADDPAVGLAMQGANVFVVPAAMHEGVTSRIQRRVNLLASSGKLHAAYIYAGAGWQESTTDSVCGGARLVVEDGNLLGEGALYTHGMLLTEIDIQALRQQRITDSLFVPSDTNGYETIMFSLQPEPALGLRDFSMLPFVPDDVTQIPSYCEDVFDVQTHGLMKRLLHTNAKRVILGVSGGLDSTLALLVSVQAMDLLKRPRTDILAVTMPGFGTTDRTYENALSMMKALGVSMKEISIKEAVTSHFKDIGHDIDCHDATYENAQARERTQILMDLANQMQGLVVGTGDLSELALGWATYNGDHMSMYAVNAALTKTLIRVVIGFYKDTYCEPESVLAKTLQDVIDTPISPELLPTKDGQLLQKTEEKIGPYELSDFYLYYCLGYGFGPGKIYRMACTAFDQKYDRKTVAKWLRVFYQRLFSQQYKRSCSPDGPGIGLIGISPRGALRMPSDAVCSLWLKELETRINA